MDALSLPVSEQRLKYVGTPCMDFSPIFEKHKSTIMPNSLCSNIHCTLDKTTKIIRHKLKPQFITPTQYRVNIYVHHNSHNYLICYKNLLNISKCTLCKLHTAKVPFIWYFTISACLVVYPKRRANDLV